MDTKRSDSESEISSNSSWTVIEEITENNEGQKSNDIDSLEVNENYRKKQNLNIVQLTQSGTSIKNQSSDEENDGTKNKENGFLTFDEYLQERMLEHDYEHPNQSIIKTKLKKSKKGIKGRRKCKAETISVLSLCATFLLVTGIALLCLVFPESVETKTLDSIKTNCQSVINNDNLDYKNVAKNFNKTMEVLEMAGNTNLLGKCADSLTKSNDNKTSLKLYENNDYNDRFKKYTKSKFLPKNVCYPEDKTKKVCYPNEQLNSYIQNKKFKQTINKSIEKTPIITNIKETKLISNIQSILANTTLRNIIQSIIHDICLLKVINYCNKKKDKKTTKNKTNKGENKTKKRIIIGTIKEGIQNVEDAKLKKIKLVKINKPKKNEGKNKNEEKVKNTKNEEKVKNSEEKIKNKEVKEETVKTPLDPLPSCSKSEENPPKPLENGKSECEKRFEELDGQYKESKETCFQHIFKVPYLKQQYREQIKVIKISNLEQTVKLNKMRKLKENYRQILRKNREFCMKELARLKFLHDQLLKEECKKNVNKKETSVENYNVPLNIRYPNLIEKIKKTQKNYVEEKPKTIEPNNKICLKTPKKEAIFKFNKIDTIDLSPTSKLTFNFDLKPEICTIPEKNSLISQNSSDKKETTDLDIKRNETPFKFGKVDEYEKLHYPVATTSTQEDKKIDESDESTTTTNVNQLLYGPKLFDTEEDFDNISDYQDDDDDDDDDEVDESSKVTLVKDARGITYKPSYTEGKHLYSLVFDGTTEIIDGSAYLRWARRLNHFKKALSKQDPQKCYKPKIYTYKH